MTNYEEIAGWVEANTFTEEECSCSACDKKRQVIAALKEAALLSVELSAAQQENQRLREELEAQRARAEAGMDNMRGFLGKCHEARIAAESRLAATPTTAAEESHILNMETPRDQLRWALAALDLVRNGLTNRRGMESTEVEIINLAAAKDSVETALRMIRAAALNPKEEHHKGGKE